MRAFIKDIITQKEASELLPGEQDFKNPIIVSLIEKLENKIGKRTYSPPSYAVVGQGQNGHDWHTDIGTDGHMSWCNYGISILLAKSKEGLFKYKDPDKVYTQEEHYLGALVHSSDQWHMVDKSTKGRTALLMFLA